MINTMKNLVKFCILHSRLGPLTFKRPFKYRLSVEPTIVPGELKENFMLI